ncbi:hypothetical protein NDU88_002080 [Pleurodeles waltl]|uniref:Uncharacterized protein n=1 Tax=Pleurodeles waltl TaxID=8319 RepID=A0AAV7Q4Z0_PLEWA|nr:hypothetical protein NDU88_002080 [Pleurodeles waltl]
MLRCLRVLFPEKGIDNLGAQVMKNAIHVPGIPVEYVRFQYQLPSLDQWLFERFSGAYKTMAKACARKHGNHSIFTISMPREALMLMYLSPCMTAGSASISNWSKMGERMRTKERQRKQVSMTTASVIMWSQAEERHGVAFRPIPTAAKGARSSSATGASEALLQGLTARNMSSTPDHGLCLCMHCVPGPGTARHPHFRFRRSGGVSLGGVAYTGAAGAAAPGPRRPRDPLNPDY